MQQNAQEPAETSPASPVDEANRDSCSSDSAAQFTAHIESLIATELPNELQQSARDLLNALKQKVAVPGHFDAFCSLAFSRPEWVAVASPLIAEMFENDEDTLAEMARIPDLAIELGSGQAAVTCIVASRWAARSETHRLTRLAESITASHASKNACAVDVMLALAATLAVTRYSRAEQLYNAAHPLAGEEHQEALADAARWLDAGKMVRSSSQEERDFWDLRLRKPRTAWSWQREEERHALNSLAENLCTDTEGGALYKAIVPACWWDLALKHSNLQQAVTKAEATVAALSVPSASSESQISSPQKATIDQEQKPVSKLWAEVPEERITRLSNAQRARGLFLVGWVCGALAMALTFFVLPNSLVSRMLGQRERAVTHSQGATTAKKALTPQEKDAWRKENTQKMAKEMAAYASQHVTALTSDWHENEKLLSGQTAELPATSPQYMKFLVWLHLDPPRDAEVRSHAARLLLQLIKGDAITLWEELVYPGSPNASDIQRAAQEALSQPGHTWASEDEARLRVLARGAAVASASSQSATTAK